MYFDKKARVRNIKQAKRVSVLLSSDSNKLLTQWKGPYQIIKKSGKVDYQLDVKGKVKTCHAKMLKRYAERCEPAVQCVMSIVSSENIDEYDGQVEEFLE